MHKNITHLLEAAEIDMGGVKIKQAFPTQNVPNIDPFLLLHHGRFEFRSEAPARHQGIGPHPHRGFTPVTFVIEGEVQHRDSRGNNQIAKKGEVQWMHAGMGIIHSERPSQELVDRKGIQEIIQLWINVPADKKMQIPKYQYLSQSGMTTFDSEDGKVHSKLVAGKYDELKSSIETESELLIIWSNANSGGQQTFRVPTAFNTMLYCVRGSIKIRGYGVIEGEHLVIFDNRPGSISISAVNDSEFIIFSGEPINEKIVQQGPYVMNSETEILEAMRDYQMGKMGILIEEP